MMEERKSTRKKSVNSRLQGFVTTLLTHDSTTQELSDDSFDNGSLSANDTHAYQGLEESDESDFQEVAPKRRVNTEKKPRIVATTTTTTTA